MNYCCTVVAVDQVTVLGWESEMELGMVLGWESEMVVVLVLGWESAMELGLVLVVEWSIYCHSNCPCRCRLPPRVESSPQTVHR